MLANHEQEEGDADTNGKNEYRPQKFRTAADLIGGIDLQLRVFRGCQVHDLVDKGSMLLVKRPQFLRENLLGKSFIPFV